MVTASSMNVSDANRAEPRSAELTSGARDVAGGRDRRIGIELFALSFAALFLELMMIRWSPSVVRLVAYYGNLMLISSFLGLGVGAMAARSRKTLLGWFGVLLAGEVALLMLCRGAMLPVNEGEVRFYGIPSHQYRNYVVLIAVFVVNAAMFVPLGQRIGRLFESLPPLRAYAWDLGGSLAGTLFFGIFSFTHFSPVAGMSLVMLIVLALLPRMARWINLPIFALTIVLVASANDPRAVWSPYYYITIRKMQSPQFRLTDDRRPSVSAPPPELRTMTDPPAYTVHVNHDFYQGNMAMDLTRYTAAAPQREWVQGVRNVYEVPHRLAARRERVLVVGAGSGADVEVALLNGAQRVDAVEIDPGLVALSRRFNASGVYDDPRVTIHVDDARAFLRRTPRRYDLLVFGYLDSQTLFSYMTNLRLDGYIYTVQSVRSAYGLLEDDGMLSLSFVSTQPWLTAKLVRMVAEATGTTPLVYKHPWMVTICAYRGEAPLNPPEHIGEFEHIKLSSVDELEKVPVPTDDWPYLYLSSMTVPRDYLVVIGTLLALSLVSVLAFRGRRFGAIDAHFALLGMGFLLLETKSITDCSLYFGTTWLVTTVVITGVLLMVLAANLLAMRIAGSPLWLYAPLFASLLVLYLVPRNAILWLPLAQRVAWTLLIVPLPIFFAGLVFSTTFREGGRNTSQLLGANLIGAMIGGFSEYLGMAYGNEKLLLLVIAAYLASFFIRVPVGMRVRLAAS